MLLLFLFPPIDIKLGFFQGGYITHTNVTDVIPTVAESWSLRVLLTRG